MLKLLLKILGGGILLLIFGSLSLFFYYTKDFPRPEMFQERRLAQSTKIFDRTGQVLLYEVYGEEKRTWAPLSVIPEYLKQAVIAAEDANFYNNFGVDLKGIARAVLADLKLKSPIFGASTIPQQLIRSTFLSADKTAERKLREIILALELDRRYPKDQILEWYLNQVPFGQNAYGAEAASQTYFGKPVSEISLPEAATLAALIKSPYALSPYGKNKDGLLARKDYILDRMRDEHFLDASTSAEVKQKEVLFVEKLVSLKAPYFTLWVKQQLEEQFSEELLREGGLRVFTSLDWEIQKIAEETVKKGVQINLIYNAHNAGMVAISPGTGEVLAMTVGTGDYNANPFPEGCKPGLNCLFDPRFNVVIGTKDNPGRQPGSAFKPFIYATAFKKGYTDQTIVVDELTNFGIWGGKEYVPQNYDDKFRGPVTLRQALSQSLNIPSIKTLLYLARLEDSVKTAQDMGITTLNPPFGPAIVLGGWEVKLLDMTSAYGVFASGGLRVEPVAILKIEDKNGNVIFKNQKAPKRVLEKNVANLINDILSDNEARTPMFGSRSNIYFENWQVAAKTGTTDNFKDTWVIGYTPSISVGIWAGNNNNNPLTENRSAITVVGPIFHDFMEKVLPRFPQETFEKPEQLNLF
jgi:membrane peptidoglycan carboxypeptidase